ncbi:MAG: tyrosine-type recombinase/integrase [Deltaproteobacteria bacterium]|nr:tyrosine-type recombinase/integrase [Deltaproteobacteria bacterium]
MANAGIIGPQATSEGLRHGFGIAMARPKLPITLILDLLGHAGTKTTETYLQVVGDKKRDMVMNAWGDNG